MLSHLRFHRRGPSNPSSPVPENNPWDTASLQPAQLVPEDGIPAPEIRPRSATSVPFAHGHGQPPSQPVPTLSLPQPQPQQRNPPQAPSQPQQYQQPPFLPPIARISSAESDLSIDVENFESKQREETKPLPLQRSPYKEGSGFIGGLALQNYRREQEALRPGPIDRNATNVSDPASYNTHAHTHAHASTGKTNYASRPPPPVRPVKAASSFATSTPHQNVPATGKRPVGVKMTSESHVSQSQAAVPDAPRGKKSLPFLKNPLPTLLMRRKTSQNMPELTLPIRHNEEPFNDPRIKGTRFHDFSAPRPRKVVSISEPNGFGVDKSRPDTVSPTLEYNSPGTEAPPVPPKDDTSQSRTSSTYSQTFSIGATLSQKSQDSGDSQPTTEFKSERNSQRRKNSIPTSISPLSRNVSEASSRNVLSSLPKHMKSTSSRFSFDMIGAAKQEKLLEDRHRQRQQGRKIEESVGPHDSRFDEFDEDAFDYDAMDYDDGLEERIPGVNADYDEEEEDDFGGLDDPDNDQENFAGFTFQRSNPVSELTSPQGTGLLPTPRDVEGNVIGYAMTEEISGVSPPSDNTPSNQNETPVEKSLEQDTPTGLGIQGFEASSETTLHQPQLQEPAQPKVLDKDDELYFDDGLIHDFDGEGDGSAFDESIFDLDDTDQYGRPIPGLFANTLSQKKADEEAKKRESDITSRLSAQSAFSQSTAHTSLSADLQSKSTTTIGLEASEEDIPLKEEQRSSTLDSHTTEKDQIAAYQAALAAATHQAAASGKFRRSSSPLPPAEFTITSPTTSASSQSHSHPEEFNDNDYDNELPSGLDDYELDDDDIIAEANASALANDSDGWYGQEFGFYSAPAPLNIHHAQPSALSEKNLFQYSHGGYFGPSGVNRSSSGRIVSREPNLTPITERSEYSNRNSIMSLGIPQSANPNAPLQSPGLAQLAMMADDDNMTLSALLRLRSKAWGGSQASLVSSRDGSPSDRNGATSPWNQEQLGYHGRKNSAFSIFTQDSTGPGSDAGSPTLTLSVPGIPNSAIPPLGIPSNSNPASAASPSSGPVFSPMQSSSACPPVFEDDELSPLDERRTDEGHTSMSSSGTFSRPFSENMSPVMGMPSQKRPGMGHRHRGSADSISYTREEESGETRWVMERRRTAESGEIEILGRQILDRGRI